MSGSPDVLAVDGIEQRFGDRCALGGVSFEVQPGAVTGLLGPNGAGKTTLMRILFGVIAPDMGELRWRGRPVTAQDRATWGYMPQERGLYIQMRVLDHLVWLARLHGISTALATANAESLLARLDLADRADDTIRDLSGGMQQRVQLAAAMVHDPELLVLDEPFAGLDPTAVEFLTAVILDHVGKGRALLFSSHQLDLVEDLCESIVMIDHGQVVLDGNLAKLRTASTQRYLRVDTKLEPQSSASWLQPDMGQITESLPTSTRIRLAARADAATVLDAVRQHAPVTSFGVEAPRLSEMFRAALRTDGGDTQNQPHQRSASGEAN